MKFYTHVFLKIHLILLNIYKSRHNVLKRHSNLPSYYAYNIYRANDVVNTDGYYF